MTTHDPPEVLERLAAGQARIVKDGPHRTVYRVDLADRSFFVKQYHGGWVAAARQCFVAGPALREWRSALEVARRDVPTIKPVAHGPLSQAGAGESFLVTQAIEQTCTLEELCTRSSRDEVGMRRKLIAGLARFCAQIHEAGIRHGDFHAGNILVRLDEETPVFHLIDVDAVRFSGPLPWPAARDSLAMLAGGIWDFATPRERLAFLRAYLRARPVLWVPLGPTSRELASRTHAHRVSIVLGRDARPLRNNKDFYRLRTRHGVAHAVTELPREALKRLLAAPAEPLLAGVDSPVKLSHSSVVVEARLEFGGTTWKIAYKRNRAKTWLKRLACFFRPRRALQGWKLGHALLARGIATPRPLAVVLPKRGENAGYLATEWLGGARDLHLCAWDLETRPSEERDRWARSAAECLGQLLGRMHDFGVRHRDLKANNLMVEERGAELAAWVIDLDGVSLGRRVSAGARASDLARLAASLRRYAWITPRVRLRFLRAYLRQAAEHGVEFSWKRLWRAIARQSARHSSGW